MFNCPFLCRVGRAERSGDGRARTAFVSKRVFRGFEIGPRKGEKRSLTERSKSVPPLGLITQ